jgi:hypothetical protein
MKKLILGIIIGLTLSIGTLSFASTQVKLVMLPEYINGYKTTDLLVYVASLKQVVDNQTIKSNLIAKYKTISQPPTCTIGLPATKTATALCLVKMKSYNKELDAWVNNEISNNKTK